MALVEAAATVPQWTLGDRLRKAREHAGISPEEMAKRLNVNKSTLYNWEADANRPRDLVSVVRQWAGITSVSTEWLLALMYIRALADPDLPYQGELPFLGRPSLSAVPGR